MALFVLDDSLSFPPASVTNEDGIIAFGGDTRPERLLAAYSQGIFPWPHEGYPLLWFCPNPRYVLLPRETHIPTSLIKTMQKSAYRVSADSAFTDVMNHCAGVQRPDQDGTWITDEMIEGYGALHKLGFAHSIEVWDEDNTLIGGLYGVSLGSVFFGESMFAKKSNASKIAFAVLTAQLASWDFDLIDCQAHTEHLERFGAKPWRRWDFLDGLKTALKKPTRKGPWTLSLSVRDAAAFWRGH